jgi:hemerythrin-like domain-containing protein
VVFGTVPAMTSTARVPAPPFAVTPRRSGEAEPDLLAVTLIHRAMRAATRLLAEAVGGIAGGAPCSHERQRAIVSFALSVLHEIHVHHEREDDVLLPVIVASVRASDADDIDLGPLVDDHTVLATLLQRADQALPDFAREPAAGAATLAPIFADLADLLDEHIAEEEALAFPIMRTHVSVGDFDRVERMFRKGTSVGQLMFLLPWIADQCTPAERAELVSGAGRPLALLLRVTEARFARRRDLVRGR